jgi:hypothetical protein
MLVILSSQIRGIVSLRELKGHVLHHMGDDGVVCAETELTMEAKSSWLATIDTRDRPFMAELADTQLFQAHVSSEFEAFAPAVRSVWGTGEGREGKAGKGKGMLGDEGGHAVEELTRQLSKSTRRLARVEQVHTLPSTPLRCSP